MKIHLIDYPPRYTACGLFPKGIHIRGTQTVSEVTCQNCLKRLDRIKRLQEEGREFYAAHKD